MRLHCELQGFAAVLRACRSGQIQPETSDRLRDYLHVGARKLLRQEYDGFPQAELLKYVATLQEAVHEGEMSTLEEAFSNVNPSLGRLVAEVAGKGLQASPENDSIHINLAMYGGSLIVGDNNVTGDNNVVGDDNVQIGAHAQVRGAVGRNVKIKKLEPLVTLIEKRS